MKNVKEKYHFHGMTSAGHLSSACTFASPRELLSTFITGKPHYLRAHLKGPANQGEVEGGELEEAEEGAVNSTLTWLSLKSKEVSHLGIGNCSGTTLILL